MSHIPFTITQGCHAGHRGALDIDCPQGTPLHAPQAGTCHTRKLSDSYGWYIRLDDGPLSIYLAHLSRFYVSEGEKVDAGDLIARSGGLPGTPGAGNSTGDHLHFEVRINNRYAPCSEVRGYIDSLFHDEEEDMTPEQDARLKRIEDWLAVVGAPVGSRVGAIDTRTAQLLNIAVVELQRDVDAIKAKLGIP